VITVIGLGPSELPEAARARLAEAALVVGSARQLALAERAAPEPLGERRTFELGGDLAQALGVIAASSGPVVVLASGDPGFFGIVRVLAEEFGRRRLEVIPAVSAVAAAFAKAGLPWDDALVVSAHGRDPGPAINACLAHPKVAVLTAPGFGPAELAAVLRGQPRRLLVAERLGEPDERVVEGDPAEIASGRWADPNVVVVFDEAAAAGHKGSAWPARRLPTRWALPEEAFDHRPAALLGGPGGSRSEMGPAPLERAARTSAVDSPAGHSAVAPRSTNDERPWAGMVTKAEVRALALARLGPGPGDLVWDVGAGSGSVAVECARLGAAVIAVDADQAARELVAANAARHRVAVTVVAGTAPGVLEGLPDPDAVFVGGSGRDLEGVLKAVASRARRAVVVALAGIERVVPAGRLLAGGGLQVETVLLQAARLRGVGELHRLVPANPVFLVTGARR
jgi:precorrin-6Y C5,15-methyltransferase (decarboxylating)